MEFDFLDKLSKNEQISNFLKNPPVGAELPIADGKTISLDETNCHLLQFYERA